MTRSSSLCIALDRDFARSTHQGTLVTVFLDFLMGYHGHTKAAGWHGLDSTREQKPGFLAHGLSQPDTEQDIK